MDKTQSGLKPFPVTIQMVAMAHRKVKTKGKAYGMDEVSMKEFEQKLEVVILIKMAEFGGIWRSLSYPESLILGRSGCNFTLLYFTRGEYVL